MLLHVIINKILKNNLKQVLAFPIYQLQPYCPYHNMVTMLLKGFKVSEYAAKCQESLQPGILLVWEITLLSPPSIPSEQHQDLAFI